MESLTPNQQNFIIDCFRIITQIDLEHYQNMGYFDGMSLEDIENMANEIEERFL